MPEIALNGLLLDYGHSGTSVYTRNLVDLLPQVAPDLDFRLYLRRADPTGDLPVRYVDSMLRRFAGRLGRQADKFLWEEVAWPVAARRADLLHSLYFSAPALTVQPAVVTIHDLIPLVLPRYYRSRQSALYSAIMARAARRARAIITVSENSRRDIVRLLNVPEKHVHVTPEAVDARFRPYQEEGEGEILRDRYALPERFVLYTGGAERRKGIETLVRAWAKVECEMEKHELSLVIVANFPPPDRLYPDIPGLVRDLDLQRVVLLRSVREEDKPALYRAATIFVFPSEYEGFGFTPLEAMASGVPVLASDVASIPEVTGGAAFLLPASNVAAWADALRSVPGATRVMSRLAQLGPKRAATFSWRRTAEQTVEVYRRILACAS